MVFVHVAVGVYLKRSHDARWPRQAIHVTPATQYRHLLFIHHAPLPRYICLVLP
jgi:hypothetical protein